MTLVRNVLPCSCRKDIYFCAAGNCFKHEQAFRLLRFDHAHRHICTRWYEKMVKKGAVLAFESCVSISHRG